MVTIHQARDLRSEPHAFILKDGRVHIVIVRWLDNNEMEQAIERYRLAADGSAYYLSDDENVEVEVGSPVPPEIAEGIQRALEGVQKMLNETRVHPGLKL